MIRIQQGTHTNNTTHIHAHTHTHMQYTNNFCVKKFGKNKCIKVSVVICVAAMRIKFNTYTHKIPQNHTNTLNYTNTHTHKHKHDKDERTVLD